MVIIWRDGARDVEVFAGVWSPVFFRKVQTGEDRLEKSPILQGPQTPKKSFRNPDESQNGNVKVVCEAEVEIKNAEGLHMRPAMQFVDVANQFDCDVTVSNIENSVDGKSIMQMSMLAATCGTKLKIKAEGADAQKAVNALQELVEEKHFDEPTPKA